MTAAVPSGTDGVVEETVLFSRKTEDGRSLRLLGTLARPAAKKSAHALGIVSLHGWAGTRSGPHRVFVRLGRAFAARGIPALRFDLSGRGESDGVAAETNLDAMIADALAAREYLVREVGCSEVAYVGLCSGGNVAIGAATLAPAAGLALVSTLPFTPRSAGMAARKTLSRFGEYLRKAMDLQTWKRLIRGQVNVKAVGTSLAASGMESAEDRRLKDSSREIMTAFSKYRARCLFVYGGNDPEASLASDHYRAFCAANAIPFQHLVIAKANHNYYTRAWAQQMERAVLHFLTP